VCLCVCLCVCVCVCVIPLCNGVKNSFQPSPAVRFAARSHRLVSVVFFSLQFFLLGPRTSLLRLSFAARPAAFPVVFFCQQSDSLINTERWNLPLNDQINCLTLNDHIYCSTPNGQIFYTNPNNQICDLTRTLLETEQVNLLLETK